MDPEKKPQDPTPATPAPAIQAEAAENLPVRIEEDGGMIATWTTNAPIVASNVSQSSPAGRALVSRALATADLKTRSAVGQILEAVAFVAHSAQITDQQTGEIHHKTRCVLILKDGRTWSTMSQGCIRTIHYISHVTESKEWDPPIRLEVREFPLEGGKSYCDLREVLPPNEPPITGKKK